MLPPNDPDNKSAIEFETSHSEKHPVATRIRWQVFGLACGASFLLYLHRYTWNVIGPNLQSELNFSHTEIAFLFSLFYYTYAAGQIPSGIIVDRRGPHRLLSAMILVWSLASMAFAFSTQFIWLAASRLLFGAAQAGCYPALTNLTGRWFPASRRTVLQGWVATTSGRAGGAVSPILLGSLLMGYFGLTWQISVATLGLVGVAFACLFWWLFRDSPSDHPGVNAKELAIIHEGQSHSRSSQAGSRSPVLSARAVVRNRSMRFFVVQQFLDAGSDVAFVALTGAYFLQSRGLNISQTGFLASLPLLGGALGGIASGWLNDWLIRSTGNRRWSRSGIGFAGKLIGCVMLLLVARQESSQGAAICLMVAKFFSDWSQPTTWGMCTDIGGRFTGTVFSIINTAGTIGGVMMPLIFGVVLDWFTVQSDQSGHQITSTNWEPLFILLAGMYLTSGVCWLFVNCNQKIESDH